jgi:hypothetical protein
MHHIHNRIFFENQSHEFEHELPGAIESRLILLYVDVDHHPRLMTSLTRTCMIARMEGKLFTDPDLGLRFFHLLLLRKEYRQRNHPSKLASSVSLSRTACTTE